METYHPLPRTGFHSFSISEIEIYVDWSVRNGFKWSTVAESDEQSFSNRISNSPPDVFPVFVVPLPAPRVWTRKFPSKSENGINAFLMRINVALHPSLRENYRSPGMLVDVNIRIRHQKRIYCDFLFKHGAFFFYFCCSIVFGLAGLLARGTN